MRIRKFVLICLCTLLPVASAISATIPPCLSDSHEPIPVNNSQVLDWEQTTQDQFLARAHVQGTITQLLPDHTNHSHFEIQLQTRDQGTLEVIYSQDFGDLPDLSEGMEVEACGDYKTANNSPAGAIIHWVHMSTNPSKHPSGFVVVNGTVYGFNPDDNAGSKRRFFSPGDLLESLQ